MKVSGRPFGMAWAALQRRVLGATPHGFDPSDLPVGVTAHRTDEDSLGCEYPYAAIPIRLGTHLQGALGRFDRDGSRVPAQGERMRKGSGEIAISMGGELQRVLMIVGDDQVHRPELCASTLRRTLKLVQRESEARAGTKTKSFAVTPSEVCGK